MSGPRVGLVLGAGGATGGAFHAAVLAGLHQVTGWDPREAAIMVGTSAGSVAAASLRAGLSAADMLARATGAPLSAEGADLLRRAGLTAAPPPLRPQPAGRGRTPAGWRLPEPAAIARAAVGGLGARPLAVLATLVPDGQVPTDVITTGVEGLTGGRWPDAPLWVCAVRTGTGRRVVFGAPGQPRPALGDAVAASCAIPGFFQPVTIDGQRYVDGGAHSPTNADVLTMLDAGPLDLVIVSSPMSITGRTPRLTADQLMRRWSRALLDAEARRLRRRNIVVVAFQPTADDTAVMGLNAMDASRRAPVANQVLASVRARLESRSTRERLDPIWARRT